MLVDMDAEDVAWLAAKGWNLRQVEARDLATACALVVTIPGNAIPHDANSGKRLDAYASDLKKRACEVAGRDVLVIVVPDDVKIEAIDEARMREKGWVRA